MYYECTQTLREDCRVISITEMKNYIISASYDDKLRIWDSSTYKCIEII